MDFRNQKALLVINPVAGRMQIQRYLTQIIRKLMDRGYLVTTAVTAARDEARELIARSGEDYDLLVCAGGDGTLNECVTGMAESGIGRPLGYIPCGSTNDFAATHGLQDDILLAAEAVAQGRKRQFDVGCFSERIFLHHALFGAFTWMAYSTDQEQKNKLGYGAYILDGIKGLSKVKPIPLAITADGVKTEGEYLFGTLSTNRFIAGIYELPETMIGDNDGKLAAVLIQPPKSVMDFDALARSILNGDPKCPGIRILTAEELIIESPEGVEWSLDGESSGLRTRAEIRAKKAFLTLQG